MQLPFLVHFDGACSPNPGAMGLGYTIHSPEGVLIEQGSQLAGHGTNNVAEYKALIAAIECALRLNIRHVHVFGDSMLVVKAVSGQWRCRHPNMRPLYLEAMDLSQRFDSFQISHIPRDQNGKADALSTKGLPKTTFRKPPPWWRKRRRGRR